MNKAFYLNLLSSGLVVLALLLMFDVVAGQTLLSDIIKSAALLVACVGLGGSAVNRSVVQEDFFIEHSQEETSNKPTAETIKAHVQVEQQVQGQAQEPIKEIIEPINLVKEVEPIIIEETEPITKVIEEVEEIKKVEKVEEAAPIIEEPEEFKKPEVVEEVIEVAEKTPLEIARAELHALENKERGAKQKEFFSHQNSDSEREYLGVNISQIVALSEKIAGYLDEKNILALLKSPVHDERILAVWTMINQFKNAPLGKKKSICDFYMAHRAYIDNWDMTDLAARNILGSYVREFGHEELIMELISSESSWDKRSAVMATHPSVIDGNIDIGFFVSEKLIDEEDELIQSAIGWVLKEAYKKESAKTERFIRDHFHSLSKQAIRIGTERMDKEYRKGFLRGDFQKVRV